jgi:anti-sigma B factor antagonist
MEIQKNLEDKTLTVKVIGRVDASNAQELTNSLNASLDGVKELIFDFTDLKYVASAGLRVLLIAQKRMNKQGKMIIRHVDEAVMEVLEMTGFTDLMTIEN